jgi:CDP-diacylglycerol--glycerol-3-phosphate 3-phosphatidyltransferase
MILPNQLTILRIMLTPVFLYFFLLEGETSKLISLAIFLVAALTDWYDGWLARKYNYFTTWGKFMDPLADKILTASAFFGFIYVNLIPWWMVIIVLSRDFIVTILRGYADYKGKSFPTSRYAKWKTAIQMIFLYYILVIFVLSQNLYLNTRYKVFFSYLLNESFIYYSMLFVTFITVHSGLTYILGNKKIVKDLFIK